MGQELNHKLWFKNSKRKILVLCYDEESLKKTIKAISKKELQVDEALGYVLDKVINKPLELELWYLSTKNRHFWMHHYPGAQGIILNFSFAEKPDDRLVFDALNIFFEENLNQIPILVMYDKDSIDEGQLLENLKSSWEKEKDLPEHKSTKADVKFFEGKIENGIDGNNEAFKWLLETMKPLA